jgi:hypothetical protein
MFVYVNETNAEAMVKARSTEAEGSAMLFDAVHPDKFTSVAAYDSIALKRLVKRLPSWALMRLRQKLSGEG